jgi:hypothetical protein
MPGIMKKQALLLSAFLALSASFAAAEPNPLYEELSRAKEVKVAVKLPTDSGATNLNFESFKKAVETALQERKSIHFTTVMSEAEAKLVVETDMKGFTFSLTDPLDMLAGAAMAAMDAAKVEHFASAEVRFIVREGEKVRYDQILRASITDPAFTEEEARERILERAAEQFVQKAFGKKKND